MTTRVKVKKLTNFVQKIKKEIDEFAELRLNTMNACHRPFCGITYSN
jgi:hypothetical protein